MLLASFSPERSEPQSPLRSNAILEAERRGGEINHRAVSILLRYAWGSTQPDSHQGQSGDVCLGDLNTRFAKGGFAPSYRSFGPNRRDSKSGRRFSEARHLLGRRLCAPHYRRNAFRPRAVTARHPKVRADICRCERGWARRNLSAVICKFRLDITRNGRRRPRGCASSAAQPSASQAPRRSSRAPLRHRFRSSIRAVLGSNPRSIRLRPGSGLAPRR